MSDELAYIGLDDETKADLREKLAVKRQVASQATHLAALLDAATPLPWRVTEGDLEGGTLGDYIARLLQNQQDDGTSTGRLWLTLAANDVDPERGAEVVPAMTGDGPRAEANARLVVAAVNALPELLDAAARAEAGAADLRRWKAEALPVFAGLQELGRTLGLPLGTSITGEVANEAAQRLVAEAADLRSRLARAVEHKETVEAIIAARVQQAKVEERERIAVLYDAMAELEAELDPSRTGHERSMADGAKVAYEHAARIARADVDGGQ